jgi:transposase
MGKRKNYSAEFKARVAIEAIKGEKTISQIASEFKIHPNLVSKWKRQFLENSYKIFSLEGDKEKELEKTIDELYKQIGQLKVERDFLSRKLGLL